MWVNIYVWIYESMWECMHMHMFECMYVGMRICVCVNVWGVWGSMWECRGDHACMSVLCTWSGVYECVCMLLFWEVSLSPATSWLNPLRGDISSKTMQTASSLPLWRPPSGHQIPSAITEEIWWRTVAVMTTRSSDLWYDQANSLSYVTPFHLPRAFHQHPSSIGCPRQNTHCGQEWNEDSQELEIYLVTSTFLLIYLPTSLNQYFFFLPSLSSSLPFSSLNIQLKHNCQQTALLHLPPLPHQQTTSVPLY